MSSRLSTMFMLTLVKAIVAILLSTCAVYGCRPIAVTNHEELTSPSWWLERGMKEAALIQGQQDRDQAFVEIAREFVRTAQFENAMRCLSKVADSTEKRYAYLAVAQSCHKSGNKPCYERSMQQVRAEANKSKELLFIYLISNYLENDDVRGAMSVADEAIPDKWERRSAYLEIVAHLMRAGNFSEAEATIKTKIADTLTDSDLNLMAISAAEKDAVRAKEIALRIVSQKERDKAYKGIGSVEAKQGHLRNAWKTAGLIGGAKEKSEVLAGIALKQAERGDFLDAEETARSITDRDSKISVLLSITEAQVPAGSIDTALVHIKEMERLIENEERPPDESKFGTFDDTAKLAKVRGLHAGIARQLAKRGDMAGNHEHIAIAQEAAKSFKPEAVLMQVLLIHQILGAQVSVGDIAGALATAEIPAAMPEFTENLHSVALIVIVPKQLELGDIEGALATTKRLGTKEFGGAAAYGEIAAKLAQSGRLIEARQLLATLDFSQAENRPIKESPSSWLYAPAATSLAKEIDQAGLKRWIGMLPTAEARAYAYVGAARGFEKKEVQKTPNVLEGQ